MKRRQMVGLVIGLCMTASGGLAAVLTPRIKIADLHRKFSLARMVPERFGDWQVDPTVVPLQVDPATQAKLDRIYNQTLARTYVDASGARIMLSLAYGGDQSDAMGVHKPEVCYAAQGFEIERNVRGTLATPFGTLPVQRLMAVSGERYEPITYWITIGAHAVQAGMRQRLLQLRYGLTGAVPDGMLVRISSLSHDPAAAWQLQARFARDLLGALAPEARQRLIGVFEGA